MSEDTGEFQEQLKAEIEKESLRLLGGIAQAQDSLATVVSGIEAVGEGEKLGISNAADALLSFLDSNPELMTARPRAVRENDRAKILPGQHGGVYLQYSLEDGTVLGVNFYGGLRMFSDQDMRDTDKTGKISHTSRTDRVISQPTNLNWQIRYAGTEAPVVDSWIIYSPGAEESFRQSALRVGDDKIDVMPTLGKKGYGFEDTKKAVFEPIRKLTNYIPSSV